jgi:hypothetical protein
MSEQDQSGVEPSSRSARTLRQRQQLVLGAVLFIAGTAMSGSAALSLLRTADHMQLAQASPNDNSKSDSNKTDEVRPTTPAPEPARPNTTTGQSPSLSTTQPPENGAALPPAPAEKVAPPITDKK